MPQVSLNMQIHQELHVRRKINPLVRPYHQMEVIPHDAIGEDPHGHAKGGFGDKCKKRTEIRGLVEHGFAMVPAIEDVLDEAIGRDATLSSHENGHSTCVPSSAASDQGPKDRLSPLFANKGGCPLFYSKRVTVASMVRTRASARCHWTRIGL